MHFACFCIYIIYLIMDARKKGEDTGKNELMPLWKCALLILVGLALIIGGGQAVVYGAKYIAQFCVICARNEV